MLHCLGVLVEQRKNKLQEMSFVPNLHARWFFISLTLDFHISSLDICNSYVLSTSNTDYVYNVHAHVCTEYSSGSLSLSLSVISYSHNPFLVSIASGIMQKVDYLEYFTHILFLISLISHFRIGTSDLQELLRLYKVRAFYFSFLSRRIFIILFRFSIVV